MRVRLCVRACPVALLSLFVQKKDMQTCVRISFARAQQAHKIADVTHHVICWKQAASSPKMGVSSSCPCRREKAAAPSKTSADAHNASSVGEGEAAAPAPASDYERAMRSLLVAPVDLSADALLTSMAHGVINHVSECAFLAPPAAGSSVSHPWPTEALIPRTFRVCAPLSCAARVRRSADIQGAEGAAEQSAMLLSLQHLRALRQEAAVLHEGEISGPIVPVLACCVLIGILSTPFRFCCSHENGCFMARGSVLMLISGAHHGPGGYALRQRRVCV